MYTNLSWLTHNKLIHPPTDFEQINSSRTTRKWHSCMHKRGEERRGGGTLQPLNGEYGCCCCCLGCCGWWCAAACACVADAAADCARPNTLQPAATRRPNMQAGAKAEGRGGNTVMQLSHQSSAVMSRHKRNSERKRERDGDLSQQSRQRKQTEALIAGE